MEYVSYVLGDELQHFLEILNQCEDSRSRLKFCCVNKEVRDVMRILDLEGMFEIYPSEQEALESFKSKSS